MIKEGSCTGKESASRLQRFPGEGNGYLLQYSGLENSMDSIVHGVAKSWIPLSNFQKQSPRNLQGAPLSLSCRLNHLSVVWPKNKWNVGSWTISIFCTAKSDFEALTSSSGKNLCCSVGASSENIKRAMSQ